MPLIYKKGDALNADCDILVHACNCKGIWGRGIAKQIREKYPIAFALYHTYCLTNAKNALGKSFTITSAYGKPNIACLFTSIDYGSKTDSPKKILKATESALDNLLETARDGTVYASPKFNAGLFNVPWEQTEKILLEKLEKHPNIVWEIYDLA